MIGEGTQKIVDVNALMKRLTRSKSYSTRHCMRFYGQCSKIFWWAKRTIPQTISKTLKLAIRAEQ
jgi:hypothetical protein